MNGQIDWESRIDQKARAALGDRFVSPESWDSMSYTMDYLRYRVEEGQVACPVT